MSTWLHAEGDCNHQISSTCHYLIAKEIMFLRMPVYAPAFIPQLSTSSIDTSKKAARSVEPIKINVLDDRRLCVAVSHRIVIRREFLPLNGCSKPRASARLMYNPDKCVAVSLDSLSFGLVESYAKSLIHYEPKSNGSFETGGLSIFTLSV